MSITQERPCPYVLASTPSSSFSSVSSAASATSAATSRSGGSKLLFGEIDLCSERSSESYASVCSFVLCDSGTFLKFWLDDQCRDTFLSYLPKRDLASLRLACHDSSVRAAPALFNDLSITFKTSTFTKPARIAALDRLGFYVKTLTFNLPHTAETFLPPLVEPETGAELSFTYTPLLNASATRTPKYGDVGTTDILTRQYPSLFHAATNVPVFIRAFSAFVNLTHLKISCPGHDPRTRHRRSVVDFALISLRIAVEQNCLNSLDTLTLAPIHPGGFLYLSPLAGYGATPRSAGRWSRFQHLTIHAQTIPSSESIAESDDSKLLQTYLRNFQANLLSFNFQWDGERRGLPVQYPRVSEDPPSATPARCTTHDRVQQTDSRKRPIQPLHFPKLCRLELDNIKAPARDISILVDAHKRTLEDLELTDVQLTSGTWDDALAPLAKQAAPPTSLERSEIPIMLSPSMAAPQHATLMKGPEVPSEGAGRRSMRLSRWLTTKGPSASRKVREGLMECEEQLKRMLKGGGLPWK